MWISLKGSGTLSPQRQQLLAERGLDVEEQDRSWKVSKSSCRCQSCHPVEDSRSFAKGLAEFEQHVKDRAFPTVQRFVILSFASSCGKVAAFWGQVWKLLRQKLMIIIGVSLLKCLQHARSCCLFKFRCLQPTSRLAVFPLVWGNLDSQDPRLQLSSWCC